MMEVSDSQCIIQTTNGYCEVIERRGRLELVKRNDSSCYMPISLSMLMCKCCSCPTEMSFIYDPLPTYDFCSNPSLLKLHGSLSFDFCRETVLRPIFQLSKFVRNPEFLTTPLEAYDNFTSAEGRKKYVPWEQKSISKLFWRGSTTGDSYSKRKDYTWHQSHRPRLALMTQDGQVGEKQIWVKARGRTDGGAWNKESWSINRLNEAYMDIGLTGGPHQCKKEDGTCDEMAKEIQFKDRVRPEDAAKYKCECCNASTSTVFILLHVPFRFRTLTRETFYTNT